MRDKDEQEYTRKKRNTRTKQATGDTNVTITVIPKENQF